MTPAFAITVFAAFGLCIGSFLNVVIYRLPKMLEAQFELASDAKEATAPLTLSNPASTCGHCGHRIPWFENIPVMSYLVFLAMNEKEKKHLKYYTVGGFFVGIVAIVFTAYTYYFPLKDRL